MTSKIDTVLGKADAALNRLANRSWNGTLRELAVDTRAGTLTWEPDSELPNRVFCHRPTGRRVTTWALSQWPDGIRLTRSPGDMANALYLAEAECAEVTAWLLRDLHKAVTGG